MQFIKLLSEYEKYLTVSRGLRKRTIENHIRSVKLLMVYLQKNRIEFVEMDLIQFNTFCEGLYRIPRHKCSRLRDDGKFISPGAVRNILMQVRLFVRFCRSIKIYCIDDRLIKIPKVRDTKIVPLNHSNLTVILHAPDRYEESKIHRMRDKLLFHIGYYTGMRAQEVIDLTEDDILDSSGTIYLVGKGGKKRTVYFNPQIMELAREYIALKHYYICDRERLISGHQPNNSVKPFTRSGLHEIFRKYQKKTGVYCTYHKLRHTFATNLCENDVEIEVVKKLLGHKTILSTQRYVSVNTTRMRNALATLSPY